MGTLRVLLACVVMFGHFGKSGFYMIGGAEAVQIFYVISGFSMSILLNEQKKYTTVKNFYLSRILKIYPSYYAVFLISLFIYAAHALALDKTNELFSAFHQMPEQFIPVSILLNITLIFQDTMPFLYASGTRIGVVGINDWPKQVPFIFTMVLPQCWSVALEIYFYALCPFFIRKKTAILALIGLSTSVNAILVASDLAYVDPWSYRFFPSQLYLFLLGIVSHKYIFPKYIEIASQRKIISFTLCGTTVIFMLLNDLINFESRKLVNAIFVNMMPLILPAFYHISRANSWDLRVGRLSYPAYLFQFVVYFLVVRLLNKFNIVDGLSVAVVAVIATLVVAYLFDSIVSSKTDKLRYRLSGVASFYNNSRR
jgi:peptidoglycan/LPS O-acetylase OafA/YrhL